MNIRAINESVYCPDGNHGITVSSTLVYFRRGIHEQRCYKHKHYEKTHTNVPHDAQRKINNKTTVRMQSKRGFIEGRRCTQRSDTQTHTLTRVPNDDVAGGSEEQSHGQVSSGRTNHTG